MGGESWRHTDRMMNRREVMKGGKEHTRIMEVRWMESGRERSKL